MPSAKFIQRPLWLWVLLWEWPSWQIPPQLFGICGRYKQLCCSLFSTFSLPLCLLNKGLWYRQNSKALYFVLFRAAILLCVDRCDFLVWKSQIVCRTPVHVPCGPKPPDKGLHRQCLLGLPGVRNMRFQNHSLCLLCDRRGVSKWGLGPRHSVVHSTTPSSSLGLLVQLGQVSRWAPNTTRCPHSFSLSRMDSIKLPTTGKVILRVGFWLLYFFVLVLR